MQEKLIDKIDKQELVGILNKLISIPGHLNIPGQESEIDRYQKPSKKNVRKFRFWQMVLLLYQWKLIMQYPQECVIWLQLIEGRLQISIG